MRTLWLGCLVVTLLAPQALAGVSAVPTRPTFSDKAHTTARGHLELELGGHVWSDEQFGIPFLLKLGLANSVELRLGGGGLRYDGQQDTFGFGNLGLYTKFRFLHQRRASPAMGVLFGVILPTATDELHEDTTDLLGLFLMTGEFGPMGWSINLGLRMLGLGHDTIRYDIPATLALSAQIFGPLGVIMEVADYIPLSGQDNRLHLLGAVTWTLNRRLILDFAFVRGFGGAPDWEVRFGLTSTLARLF